MKYNLRFKFDVDRNNLFPVIFLRSKMRITLGVNLGVKNQKPLYKCL